MKAMEMMLNSVTAIRPRPMVTISPDISVAGIETMILKDLSASHSSSSTPPIIAPTIR